MPSRYDLASTRLGTDEPAIERQLRGQLDRLDRGETVELRLSRVPGYARGNENVTVEADHAVFLDREEHSRVPVAIRSAVKVLPRLGFRGRAEIRLLGDRIWVRRPRPQPSPSSFGYVTSHKVSASSGKLAVVDDGCEQIHLLLQTLPDLDRPSATPFADGLYFFYEQGESSAHGPAGRIVRVGNHPRKDGALIQRLGQHYFGNKNGSVFRKYLGGALLRTRNPNDRCLAPAPGKGHWELQDAKVCARCAPVEREVSELMSSEFRFRCVAIENRVQRNHLERRLIATVASCSACGPSSGWLGLHAYSENVRRTGLWNSQHVDGPTVTQEDLDRFAELIGASATAGTRS